MHIAPSQFLTRQPPGDPYASDEPAILVDSVQPYRRHQLVCQHVIGDAHHPDDTFYMATTADGNVLLKTSRTYKPEQAHFNWLVEHGFPRCPYLGIHGAQGPWSNDTLDRAILDDVFGAFDFADMPARKAA